MAVQYLRSSPMAQQWLSVLCGLMLLLCSCNSGGQSGSLSPQAARNPRLEQQAVENLLALYRMAIVQEDIDRLQELLQPATARSQEGAQTSQGTTRQEASVTLTGAQLADAMADVFRRSALLDLRLTGVDMRLDHEPFSIAFQETLSLQDPATLEQRTQVFRTTWQLTQDESNGTVTIRIAAVVRDGPVVQVTTPGQVLAGTPARLEVTAAFALAGAQVEVPETGETQTLAAAHGARRRGVFTPPAQPAPQALRIHIQGQNGEVVDTTHQYRLRMLREGVVQRLPGTGSTRFLAVAAAADGTVWGGGDTGASLYQVAPGGSTATLVGALLADPSGRVTGLTFDQRGRLQAIVLAPQTSGAIVIDRGVFCQTVNVFNALYPFRVQDPESGVLRPSPCTRAVAAGGGDILLFGSDGGVARVADNLQGGQCLEGAVAVRYDPVFRREESALLSNTVPALLASDDDTLWFGTALGLTRLRAGQFTPVLFRRELALPSASEIATLEGLFQKVAEAIFEARPLSTVAVGNVSFVELFGRPLIKEDVIFSAVDDGQGQIWVGTLGGGLRRISTGGGTPQETLHLTRQEGLGSNIIFALAVGPDQTIWAATEEGVSRLQVTGEAVAITNFSALDGLALPVRDVAVDRQGVAWLATDGGLFRILSQGGSVQGVVLDPTSRPVADADVSVQGTPFRAVTDPTGRFILPNLPPGPQRLQIEAQAAVDGPFIQVERNIVVTTAPQTLEPPIVVTRTESRQLRRAAGDAQTGVVRTPLGLPLVVSVVEASGQPAPGVAVTFAVTRGTGAALSAQAGLTDAQGQAATALTLGPQVGQYEVTATTRLSPLGDSTSLTFIATATPDFTTARLVRVAGNNQSGQPGEVLLQPLIVRLLDQFGNPVVGKRLTADVQRGQGTLTVSGRQTLGASPAGPSAEASTDDRGEVRFALQAGSSADDIVVQVAVARSEPDPQLQQVAPVQFLTIIGMVDITDIPLDLAVTGDVVYVAAGFAGLQALDVHDPRVKSTPVTTPLTGVVLNVAVTPRFVYTATFTPTVFSVLDLTPDPLHPVVVGSIPLDANSTPVKIVVRDTLAYVALDNRSAGTGTLSILDIATPTVPRLLSSVALAGPPNGLTVDNGFAYMTAGTAGLLVMDVRDALHPTLSTSGTLPNLKTSSGIMSTGPMAYLIENQASTLQFRVLDLRTPGAPVARGTTQFHAAALPFTASTIAVADGYAYVASFDLGLQVFDVHNPETPQFVGGVATPSVAFNVATVSQASGTRIYITDLALGLSVVAGPPSNAVDTDGDGVIDFFDAFPIDPQETLDTDRDGIGDNVDPDADNDGVSDVVELQQGTDPRNPLDFPIPPPVVDATNTLFVDAVVSTQAGNGSAAAPYRSISAALKAVAMLRAQGVAAPLTVAIGAGIYSTLQTRDAFPLIFRDGGVTLRGAGAEKTIIDAAFFANVVDIVVGGITIDGLTLQHGVDGLVANASRAAPGLMLRHTRITENLFLGLSVGGGVAVRLEDNQVTNNGFRGVEIFNDTPATLTGNTIRGNEEVGVLLFNAAASISNNTITDNGQDGLQVTRASAATIRHNTLRANAAVGILVADVSTVSALQGNVVEANASSGIIVQSGSLATITDNDIRDNGRETFQAGILVSGVGTSGTLRMNRLAGNGFGIVVLRGQAEIASNTIRTSVVDGVALVNKAVSTVSGNTVERNGRYGLLLVDAAFGTITTGTLSANGADGLNIQGGARACIAAVGPPLSISANGGNGITVKEDSGTVGINRSNILFQGNGGQDIAGTFLPSCGP